MERQEILDRIMDILEGMVDTELEQLYWMLLGE